MSSVIIAGDTSGTITLAAPAVSGSSVLTMPVATDTLVGKATTDTLTNKTLTSPVLDTAVTGTAVATQAQQETGTATNVLVTPGRQQYHPSAAKAWVKANTTGGSALAYNVASVTDTAVGRCVVNLTTAFSSAEWAATATAMLSTSLTTTTTLVAMIRVDTSTASAIAIDCIDVTGTNFRDPNYFLMSAFGDQA